MDDKLHMISVDELLRKVENNEPITYEDMGLPSWRSECDGFVYELSNLFCRSGFAYKHKDGYRWSNGDFLTKRELRIYNLQ
jgi:hypothetical protein